MTAPRVLIVGAGPAGVRAAEAVVRGGLRPVVVDEGDACGGQIYRQPPAAKARPAEALYGADATAARALHADFAALLPAIDYYPRTLVWNLVTGANLSGPGQTGFVHVHDRAAGAVGRLDFTHVVLATGATDRVLPVPGWTLPGVFTLGGAQVALKGQGCLIGRRVAFLGTGPLLYLVALQYAKAGAKVVVVADTSGTWRQARAFPGLRAAPGYALRGMSFVAQLMLKGVPILRGVVPGRIEGADGVERVTLRHRGGEKSFACDAVGLGFGLRSETQLADLAGVPRRYDAAQANWVPRAGCDGRTPRSGVYVAGDGAGILGAQAAELRGARAGLAVLADAGGRTDPVEAERLEAEIGRWVRFRRAIDAMYPVPVQMLRGLAAETVVCRCEHITLGDLRRVAANTGAEDANRLKSFSRAGMGRCQGRFCADNVQELAAFLHGAAPAAMGTQRAQMPIKPVPVGDLLRQAPRTEPVLDEAVLEGEAK